MAPSKSTTATSVEPGTPATRSGTVQDRLTHLDELSSEAERSLRLWRVVLYTVGLAAVVAASAAGLSSLGDIWGSRVAGFLALAAAVLASVDKFLSAGDKITKLDRRWQSLEALRDRALSVLTDARSKESRLDARDDAANAAYDAWLADVCGLLDARLEDINDRLDRV